MANSYTSVSSPSLVATQAIGFDYLADSHVKVHLDGTLQTAYTINSLKEIVKDTGSWTSSGGQLLISRDTPITGAGRLVDFTAGSVLTESDLDTAHLQTLYKMQEMDEHRGVVTVASATALPMDSTWSVVKITGTTEIESVAAGVDGQTITMIFSASTDIKGTEENVIALQGDDDYEATVRDTLVLFYDLAGTRWVEVSRSVN